MPVSYHVQGCTLNQWQGWGKEHHTIHPVMEDHQHLSGSDKGRSEPLDGFTMLFTLKSTFKSSSEHFYDSMSSPSVTRWELWKKSLHKTTSREGQGRIRAPMSLPISCRSQGQAAEAGRLATDTCQGSHWGDGLIHASSVRVTRTVKQGVAWPCVGACVCAHTHGGFLWDVCPSGSSPY